MRTHCYCAALICTADRSLARFLLKPGRFWIQKVDFQNSLELPSSDRWPSPKEFKRQQGTSMAPCEVHSGIVSMLRQILDILNFLSKGSTPANSSIQICMHPGEGGTCITSKSSCLVDLCTPTIATPHSGRQSLSLIKVLKCALMAFVSEANLKPIRIAHLHRPRLLSELPFVFYIWECLLHVGLDHLFGCLVSASMDISRFAYTSHSVKFCHLWVFALVWRFCHLWIFSLVWRSAWWIQNSMIPSLVKLHTMLSQIGMSACLRGFCL